MGYDSDAYKAGEQAAFHDWSAWLDNGLHPGWPTHLEVQVMAMLAAPTCTESKHDNEAFVAGYSAFWQGFTAEDRPQIRARGEYHGRTQCGRGSRVRA